MKAKNIALCLILLAALILSASDTRSDATSKASVETAGQTPTSDDQTIAFVNVNVIPMGRETVLEDQTVIVRKGRIASIDSSGKTKPPKGAFVIDGRGQYLMPGLADLHIHLRSTDELISYLAYGVTTVLHMSGAMSGAPDILAYRLRLSKNEMTGPTLYTTGPNVDGDPPIFRGVSVAVNTAEDARRVVAEQKRAGYDFIKVYNRIPPEAYEALIEAARAVEISVIGHIPRQVGAERALASGQAMIAHGEEYFFTFLGGPTDSQNRPEMRRDIDQSKIPFIVKATLDAKTAVTPNLSFIAATRHQLDDIASVLTDPETRYLHPNVLRMWKSNNPTNRRDLDQFSEREKIKYTVVRNLTKVMNDAGVPLLLGTDSSAPGLFPGQSAHLELREMKDAGLTPYEALAAATKNAGEFISKHVRNADKFGKIVIGYRADLILLSENPLKDISAVSRPRGVMTRGRWLTTEQLQQVREEFAARYK